MIQFIRKNIAIIVVMGIVVGLSYYLYKSSAEPILFTMKSTDSVEYEVATNTSSKRLFKRPTSSGSKLNATLNDVILKSDKPSTANSSSKMGSKDSLTTLAGGTLLDYSTNGLILAFGDSLTHGLYVDEKTNEWRNNHPYAIKLTELLRNKTRVVESGISGELTGHMVERLPSDLKEHSPNLVILLGGTNDIGHEEKPEKIVENIKKLHQLALRSVGRGNKKATYTIAVTIPQSGFVVTEKGPRGQGAAAARLEINAAIRDFAKKCSKRVALLDLESTFDQRKPENKKYWSPDTLHFSKLGYDGFGELLFNVISTYTVLPVAGEKEYLDQCI
jgi:lysophospholipase L1-like esterase